MLLLLWRLHPTSDQQELAWNVRVRPFSPYTQSALQPPAPRGLDDRRTALTPVPARAMSDRRVAMDDLVPRPMRP